MNIAKKLFSKFLSHPAWTGVGTLIAIATLFITLYPQENKIHRASLKTNKIQPPHSEPQKDRKYVSQRIALLVGISDYGENGNLKNPVRDIDAIAVALKSKGFKIIRKRNATSEEIKQAISDFQTMLSLGGIGLFFYSGHGVRVDDNDYLITKETAEKIKTKEDVKRYAINFSKLLMPIDRILEYS